MAAVDIVDVIGAAVDLKPAGTGRFVALCPFHQEKTPSFSVSRDKQLYYCFGCGKSGDVVSFLREFEGLSFFDALQRIADRGGVRLPALTERDDKEEYQRSRLFDLNKAAAGYFRRSYEDPLKGGIARNYVSGRRLGPETVKRFGIGYAPDDSDAFLYAMREAGFKEAQLEQSGLVRRNERGALYAFFRRRLMIPIRDGAGRVVAFGGRDLSGDSKTAKYINTPENPVYRKGRELYGLFEAREALRREKRALLVEGYFDLMRCFDCGIENVAASCGTALTSSQAALLCRHVREVVIVYDGDPAGVRAALRGVGVLTAAGLSVHALLLPENRDPDDFVLEYGPEAFRSLVEKAPDFVTFYTRMNAERTAAIEGRTEVARELFAILMNIDDELRRDEYLKHIGRELRVDIWTLRREFQRMVQEQRDRSARSTSLAPTPRVTVNQDDCAFIATLLHSEPLRTEVRRQLADIVLQPGPLAEVLRLVMDDAGADSTAAVPTEAAAALLAAAANSPGLPADRREEVVAKRIVRLKRDALLAESQQILEAIREAELQHDAQKVMRLVSRRIGITREIEKLGAA